MGGNLTSHSRLWVPENRLLKISGPNIKDKEAGKTA
jgi:hypothetical protein